MNVAAKKICLELITGFIYFLFKGFGGGGTKNKPLIRTEKSSSVNV